MATAADSIGSNVKVHLKVDTGMGRLGIQVEDAANFARKISSYNNIIVEGIYTHFAKADSRDKDSTRSQFAAFKIALDAIKACGVKIPIKHCANSAALLDMPETHLDMVRAGISLYGLYPSAETSKAVNLIPAMRFKTQIAMLKKVRADTPISYGWTYRTSQEAVIATLPVGYADVWTRMLNRGAQVSICGKKAPVVGRICMDQCMVDVSEIPGATEGEDVLLFGGLELPVEDVASSLDTINYEVVCMVSQRVPRIYVRH